MIIYRPIPIYPASLIYRLYI